MSQHDMNVADSSFPTFRADMNNAFQALVTNNSGPTAPATPYPNQFWYDTTSSQFKIRNSDNDAWVTVAYFDEENGRFNVASIDPTTLANLTAFDMANDLLMVWDDSASVTKKLPLQTLADSLQTGLTQNVRNFIPKINVTDPTHDIDFYRPDAVAPAFFIATDGAGNFVAVKSSTTTVTKQLDATWASGDNVGGLALGTPGANTGYFCFALFKSSGTGIDFGFDEDINATNLMNNAAVEAAGYDLFTRVGSLMTDASAEIIPGTWCEVEGGALDFVFDDKVTDLDLTAPDTIAVTNLHLTCPPFCYPTSNFQTKVASYGRQLYVYVVDNNDGVQYSPIVSGTYTNSQQSNIIKGLFRTDENSEVSYQLIESGGYNGTFQLFTLGWKEVR